MKLLLKRSQAKSTHGRPKYRLWAKLEFEDDEQTVINHYKFKQAKLVEAAQPHLLRNSVLVGLVVLGVTGGLFLDSGIQVATAMGVLVGAGAGWFYYDRHRETIFVNDLVHGRNFDCGSIIELVRKEAWLGLVTSFLRQVMESAKTWDGTEARPIEALSEEEAKYVVIRGL